MVLQAENESSYDRESELNAFDSTKAGVKGLVDSGIAKVPLIFKCKQCVLNQKSANNSLLSVPTIDLEGIHKDTKTRTEIINEVKSACDKWGFFQVVNHRIPISVLSEIKDGVRRFHELDCEAKKEFYSRDFKRKVSYHSSVDLFKASSANWRDTFVCHLSPDPPTPEELPEACRDAVMEYKDHVKRLGKTLFELLSEALGLSPSHLKGMDCGEDALLLGHYYPACPEPESTMGTTQHTDATFITVLLQDQIGGLQILHDSQWVDVPPTEGALVINVGDFLQLISNDKFISVYHRVIVKKVGPRISVACFFRADEQKAGYIPIKELLSDENPPIYGETNVSDYMNIYFNKELKWASPLQHFKL